MLVLKHNLNLENMEFQNSTQLKEFLQIQNPTMLKKYIQQLKILQPNLVIDGIGLIRIYKNDRYRTNTNKKEN